MCQKSDVADKICNDKYFWEQKFNRDNLTILKYRKDVYSWGDEYDQVNNATINTDDIIKIV